MSADVRVLHACLETGAAGVPLPISRLTDQQRLAVLLQAAGLLSLLDRAGWTVIDWTGARIAPDGRLTLPEAPMRMASRAMPLDILEWPRVRSTKTIGVSPRRKPSCWQR